MQDIEVEAALVMMGAALQWKDDVNKFHSTAFLEEGRFYFVGYRGGYWSVLLHDVNDEEEVTVYPFSSSVAAKVACERHCATGWWE